MHPLRPLLAGLIGLAACSWIRQPRASEAAVAPRRPVEARSVAPESVETEAVAAEPRRLPSLSPAAHTPPRELLWRVARHLRRVYGAICAEDHAKAVDLCEEILLVDPGYGFAEELRTFALRLQHMNVNRRYLVSWLELWDAATDPDAALIPKGFRAPDRVDDLIALLDNSPHGRPKGISGGSLTHEDYLEEAALHRRLADEAFDLDLPWASLADVLDAIHHRAALDVHVQEDPDWANRASVRVRGLPLREGLDAALEPFGLRLTVMNGVLLAFKRRS